MEDSTLGLARRPRIALFLSALFGQVAWGILPLARRVGINDLVDVALCGLAPIFFMIGVVSRRRDCLILGVPLSWIAVVPFAPRDQLGEGEVFTMAVSLVTYLLSVIAWSDSDRGSIRAHDIQWQVSGSPGKGQPDLIGVVISGAVLSASLIILWMPVTAMPFVAYTPGATARLKVAMILGMTLFGLVCLHRAKRIRTRIVPAGRAMPLLLFGLGFACTLIFRRLA
ncbi:MAG: hypothetical protein VX589_11625 [Myxococcota bacterium]|nr:hypothetical protein [Myxococcota bacterium]